MRRMIRDAFELAREPPVIARAATVASAVADAVGVRIVALPSTPARVVTALQNNSETGI